jgi:hypothetical protein
MNASFLRRHLTTLVLVILATAGVVVLFVVDKGQVTTTESDRRKKNLLPVWRLEDVRSVTLTAHGKTAKISLGEPNAAGQKLWEVEIDGARFLANQQTVDQLMGTLEFASFERRVSQGATAESELGFASPATTVTVEMGPNTYRIAVGGTAPTPKDARYCDVQGQGVFVITAQLAAALDMRPESLRTRTFVPYLSPELASLVVDGEGGARHFVRASWSGSRGAGFRFDGSTPEGSVRANAEAVDRLLGALATLQAETFLADDAADKALQKRVTLTLVPKDGAKPKAVIEIGGACPDKDEQVVAVRREPSRTSACVSAQIMDTLTRPASDYVDLSVVGARPDDVSELSVVRDDRTVELARLGTEWHMRKPSDRKVDLGAGNALVAGLTSLDGTKIASGSPRDLGLDPPRATVRVVSPAPGVSADGGVVDRIETVEIGAPQGDVVHVRRLEDGTILEVPADKARALYPTEVVLRDTAVLDLPRDQIRSLTVQPAAHPGARTQRLTRGPNGWTFVEPAAPDLLPDAPLVDDVIEAISGLRALRWVADRDDGSFGLEKPRFVIEATASDADGGASKTARVLLGAETKDGVFARTGDDPAVFVAPRLLEDVASVWLFDRQALVVDPGAIVRVEAAAEGGKKLVAERAGDVWKSTSAEGADVAATLRAAVSGLVSEGAVSMGSPDKSFGLDKPRLMLTVVFEQSGPKDGPRRTLRVAFGAGDSFHGTSVVYARREGLDVTYAVALGKVRALFEAAGVR